MISPTQADAPKDWHAMQSSEVLEALECDLSVGLNDEEIEPRRERYGANRITEPKQQSKFVKFLLQFHQSLVYILLAAALVAIFLQEWVDAIVIFAVVLMNSVIGYLQEAKAANAISALSKSLQSVNTVLRAGKKHNVSASDLVPGDVVLLKSGDKVPADLRLLDVRDLKIDESALTGESVPAEKNDSTLTADQGLADRRNMAYSSTFVTFGTAKGIVTSTGDLTEIGRISALIAATDTLDTPLTKRIAEFSHYLIYAILALSALAFMVGFVQGKPLVESFMASVALAVAAIPEGLPAAVTIMLAIGVSRMAKRRAIVRRLPAVETLGSTTIVCSDKTGTLTQNQMTVQEIATVDGRFEVSGTGYNPEGAITAKEGDLASKNLIGALVCGRECNDATLRFVEELWRVEGDPTEGALVAVSQKYSDPLPPVGKRVDELPFESAHQYMATLNTHEGSASGNIAYVKGAFEQVLPRCSLALNATGESVPFDLKTIVQEAESMAARGLRVLAFAQLPSPSFDRLSHEVLKTDLVFLGLQAMIDPPRPEAIEAIAAFHTAGVGVKMITGDHVLTATTIARQLNLGGAGKDVYKAVSGAELDAMNDAEFTAAALTSSVFARVTPDNKYRLVEALQAEGHVVAMTGDGVNDAPALRRADIGIAMALGGTEVARDASDMMLTDDNFATIKAAVEEGRGIFDNLKKFIVWTLPTNGGEGLVILLAILLGGTLPILPVQILWINLTTAILLGLMLVFEPKEHGIMTRPPQPPGTAFLDGALLFRIALVSVLLCIGAFGLFEYELSVGSSDAEARTVAVAVFVIGEAFYLLNCRSLKLSFVEVGLWSNPWIWAGISGMAVLQLAFTYVPLMNIMFQTAPIGLDSWLRALAWGFLIFSVVGIEKKWRRRGEASPAQLDSKSV
ncbi:MAG: Ca2+-transporting ATPase [Candidatus Azotimanducaceae bacterium]|jgi:Ca2+-transporting ATPase